MTKSTKLYNVVHLALDVDGGFLEQLVGRLLLLVGDEAKVFGFVVLAPVDRSLELDDGAELAAVSIKLFFPRPFSGHTVN